MYDYSSSKYYMDLSSGYKTNKEMIASLQGLPIQYNLKLNTTLTGMQWVYRNYLVNFES